MEFYDQVFDQTNTVIDQWTDRSFEKCGFRQLDLSRTALVGANFIDCQFDHCNLTAIELKNTKLYGVRFIDCKLAHVDFSLCNPFGFHAEFQDCQLDYAIFLNRKLKRSYFTDCSLKEAYFLKCDLAGTVFRQCNLELARFEENDLTQADFSSSYNLVLNPDDNKVKKARFSLHNLPGLLTKYNLVISN